MNGPFSRYLADPLKNRLRSVMDHQIPVQLPANKLSPFRLKWNAVRLKRTRSELPVNLGRIVVNKLDTLHHYYVLALIRAMQAPEAKREKTIADTLRSYMEQVTIANSAQRLGLIAGEVPLLDQAPPWVIVYPWQNIPVDEAIRLKNRETLDENQRDGVDLDAWQGGASYPLASEVKLESEAKKMLELLTSIRKSGYQINEDPQNGIGAKLLVNESADVVWCISGGFHRCCVLAALGYRNVPATVSAIIHRKQVRKWPLVKTGLFSEKTALKLFDNIFHGRGFAEHNQWMEETLSGAI